jgi:hypothetical protein
MIRHLALTPNAVSTVNIGPDVEMVEVLKRTIGGELWFTLNGNAPTLGGDNVEVIPDVIGSLTRRGHADRSTTVKLLSDAPLLVTLRY